MIDVPLHDQPMKLVPNRIDRGYPGGREIDKFRGLVNAVDDNSPEAWVGSTTYTYHHGTDPDSTLGLAQVLVGESDKLFLKDVIDSNPVAYLGARHVAVNGPNLAVLVKLLDAKRQLGLQAHPDRSFAKKMFRSDYGKAESWYVLGTRDDQVEPPYVLLGFKEGITRAKFQELFLQKNISAMEAWCHKIPVSVGDMYFVDAGVPHAIGPGCFVIEVQEPSDITVGARMREFISPEETEAFIEKTMGCYHYVGRSYQENLNTYLVNPQVLTETSGGTETRLLGQDQTPFFSVTRLYIRTELESRATGTFAIGIVVDGRGELAWNGGEIEVKKGDEIFVPAGVRNLIWRTDCGLSAVVCHPPGVL